MKLFKDVTDSPMEFNIKLFSPLKNDVDCMDVGEMLTPVGKGRLPKPVIIDEDSGLGPELEKRDSDSEDDEDSRNIFQIRRPLRKLFDTPCSSRSKRPFLDDGESPLFPIKTTRRHSPDKETDSFKFGDGYEQDMEKAPTGEMDVEIKSVVDKFVDQDDLIADGSAAYCLPTVKGKHSDLKSITPETMADVLNGVYDDVIEKYRIIDCRYPYEYDGGHVAGAENLYTEDNILSLLKDACHTTASGKREILIFHCEFSSERGPKMSRLLRKTDRETNAHNYPSLCYPEVYLLHNGYKMFFENKKEHCEPMSYKPMLHEDHGSDLRHFRVKSKSYTYGEKRKRARRSFDLI